MGNVPDSWELRCGPLEAELARTRYGYAMTPFPNVGGLDLAGLFMDRKKFASTGIYFSKWAMRSLCYTFCVMYNSIPFYIMNHRT